MAKIEVFYWKLFFSAYWIAYNLGEKDEPQINASYFMVLVSGFNFTGVVFLINYINDGLFPNPQIYFILAYLIPIVFHVNLLYFVNGGYKKKIDEYEFLSKKQNRSICLKYLIAVVAISILVMFSGVYLFRVS